MPNYVTSLRDNARLAHIGSAHSTLCRIVLGPPFRTSDDMPADRTLCPRCAGVAAVAWGTDDPHTVTRDAVLVALLKEGHDNGGVARRLNVGLRTAVRWLTDAQRRAGATTRVPVGVRGRPRGGDVVTGPDEQDEEQEWVQLTLW